MKKLEVLKREWFQWTDLDSLSPQNYPRITVYLKTKQKKTKAKTTTQQQTLRNAVCTSISEGNLSQQR